MRFLSRINAIRNLQKLCRVAIGTLLVVTCAIAARGQDTSVETPPKSAAPNNSPDAATEITAVPNRPTFATTGETVQRGVFEIEYGFEGGDGHQNVNGLLKFGIFKDLELRFGNNPIQRDVGVAGRGDSSAGFKYRFISQRKTLPTIGLVVTAAIPTATAALGIGAMGYSAQLLLSKDFGKHHVDVNGGVGFVGRPGRNGFDRSYFSAFSYSHPIKGKLAYSAELAGFSWTNRAAPATMTILAAPTYSVSSRLVLDAGAYVAIYGNLPKVTCFFGVTYAVGNVYRHFSRKEVAR